MVGLIFWSGNCAAGSYQHSIDSLKKVVQLEKNAQRKIIVLKIIIEKQSYSDFANARDSTFGVAVSLCRQHHLDTLESGLYLTYFRSEDLLNIDSAEKYLAALKSAAAANPTPAANYDAAYADAVYIFKKRVGIDSCIIAAAAALKMVPTNRPELLVDALLLNGKCNYWADRKLDAFECYTKALQIAQKLENDRLVTDCFLCLADFYRLIGNFDMALFYNRKQREHIKISSYDDSIRLNYLYSERASIFFDMNSRDSGETLCKSILKFADRGGFRGLKNQAFWYLRTYLVSNQLFPDIYKLYRLDFPGEYEAVRAKDSTQFLRISAFILEGKGDRDSAAYYYAAAEARLLHRPKDKIFVSNFLKRYGQFLLRVGDLKAAEEKFKLSFDLASSAHYVPYMADATHYLDSISAVRGDSALAYRYAMLNTRYSDSLAMTTRNSQLLKLEIQNEENQLKYADQKEKERIAVRHHEQLIAFGIGIVALAVIVVVVLRNYKVQQQLNKLLNLEKGRSDQLLLNILPQEVAEELKDKGRAAAKYFENVTVIFTDFKGFTTISERLTPQELVNELHECFTEFDRISKKYGIEKIKTVGDAYLAVCGLPAPDANHAENAVRAAKEIAAVMVARKKELGDRTFEIRIGLHSGSVVAGIVGVSKFAYDIWGDTVNTAARMEQNSEAGKINISEATYALVSDKFECTYRGKIAAKNKGELGMYFVN